MRVLFNKNFSVTAAQIAALRGSPDERSPYEVWASHSDPAHPSLRPAQRTLTEPAGLLGDAYCEWLLGACTEHGVRFLIPGKERERLAGHAPAFAAAGVGVLAVASEATQRHLERKDEFLRAWDPALLPIPRWRTFRTLGEFDAAYAELRAELDTGSEDSGEGLQRRLCMKPARGIYASGFRVLLERPDPTAFLRGELYQLSVAAARELLAVGDWPTMLLMQTLEGHERSIDCVAWEGRLIAAVVRRKGGSGQLIEDRPDLVEATRQVTARYGLSGIFNLQTKDDQPGGQAHLLEINGRASGGLRYSLAAGINFPRLLLDAATGRLDWDALPRPRTGLRVFEDKQAWTW